MRDFLSFCCIFLSHNSNPTFHLRRQWPPELEIRTRTNARFRVGCHGDCGRHPCIHLKKKPRLSISQRILFSASIKSFYTNRETYLQKESFFDLPLRARQERLVQPRTTFGSEKRERRNNLQIHNTLGSSEVSGLDFSVWVTQTVWVSRLPRKLFNYI